MRHFFLLGMTILLASCTASQNYYAQTLQSWHGGKAQILTKQWGRPDQVATDEQGNSIYTYKTSSYRRSIAPTSQAALASHGFNSGSHSLPLECSAVFVVNKRGTILNTTYLGNGCYGSENFANRLSNPK